MEPKSDGQNGLFDHKPIRLKALVDKQNNRMLFAESDGDFVDILFSFLTMPMGTIIRNSRERPPVSRIGCFRNIYSSAENFDKSIFRTEACKTMLLYPRNGAASQCKNLKLKIVDDEPLRYFLCNRDCTDKHRVLSHCLNDPCACGKLMNHEIILSQNEVKRRDQEGGVFVEAVKYIVSDELEVMPLSTATSYAILSNLGVTSSSTIEEREFPIGVNEVLDLLKFSLASKKPLTNALLKREVAPELTSKEFGGGSSIIHQKGEHGEKDEIVVKMFVSKSKKMFCFAEANEDFVNLLFSFLTIPLGYIAKQMHDVGPVSKGCINHIYRGAMDVDTQNYLKSNIDKGILLNPQVAPGFGYKNQLLDVVEGPYPKYYYWVYKNFDSVTMERLSTVNTFSPDSVRWVSGPQALRVKDPKTPYNEAAKNGGGFVKGPATFIITDNLIISPMSTISTLSILHEMKVDFRDLDVQVVHVGKDEAKSLLMASLISESALTDVFLRKELNTAPTVVNLPKKPKEEC